MGCDIHTYFEIKLSGKWHLYSQGRFSRNYQLFGMMAGVRCPEKVLFAAKGMPDDASTVTNFACNDYGSDGHSHSWLSKNEMAAIRLVHGAMSENPHEAYRQWSDACGCYWFDEGEEFPKAIEDVRLAFWFDN